MPRRSNRAWLALSASLLALALTGRARANGLTVTDPGVRPTGRAGAYVAGADDVTSVTYNAAGLAEAGSEVRLDLSYVRLAATHTRVVRVTDGDGAIRDLASPPISGDSPFVPLPTVLASLRLSPRWVIAGGIDTPAFSLLRFGEASDGSRATRYAFGSLEGSLATSAGVWASYLVSPSLAVGFGVRALAGTLRSSITLNVNPADRLLGAPEQQDFDAQGTLRTSPFVAPSADLGAVFAPSPWVRFGVALAGPTYVHAPAAIDLRLPSSAMFDRARVTGNDVTLAFWLPPVVRVGVELRPSRSARIEAAYVREFWSFHDEVTLTSDTLAIRDVTGAPASIGVPKVVIPRGFVDTSSFRLGGELALPFGKVGKDRALTLRAGARYDTSAVPEGRRSVGSLDVDHVLVTAGLGVDLSDHVRVDVAYGHLFTATSEVSPGQAELRRVSAFGGSAASEPINGGTYTLGGDVFGVGGRYRF